MKRVTVCGGNLAPWVAIFAVLFFLAGCSRLGDLTGPQSSTPDGTAETFEPLIYDYPETANDAPEGYQLVHFHDSKPGVHVDDGDEYDHAWQCHWRGLEYEGVASKIRFENGGSVRWNASGISLPSGALDCNQTWIWMTREDPAEPWIDFGPHGTVFEVPVTIRISYANCQLPEGVAPEDLMLFYWNEVTGEYEFISDCNNLEGMYLEGQTDHFSRYIIATAQ